MTQRKIIEMPPNDETQARSSAITYILLILLLLAALYLRINGLGKIDLGFDETIHTYAALSILENGEPVMPSGIKYFRSLPFTYSVVFSFKIFGVSELSARIPSITYGLLSILLVFFIGQNFFGTTAGLIAAFLMAYLPFEIVQSRSCRMYSMYQFFFLLSFFTFYRAIENPRNERRIAQSDSSTACFSQLDINIPFLVLSLLLLYLTYRIHLLIAFFYLSVSVYLTSMYLISHITHPLTKELRIKYLSYTIIWIFIGLVYIFMPGKIKIIKFHLLSNPTWASYLQAYPGYYYSFLRSQSLFPILIFFVVGSIQVCTRLHRRGYYILVCTIVPLFMHSIVLNVQKPRYIYDIFPLILLISSYSISNFIQWEYILFTSKTKAKIKGNLYRKLSHAVVLLFSFLAIVLPFYKGIGEALRINELQAYTFGGQYNAEWRRACQYLSKYFRREDVLIATNPLAAEFAGCEKVQYNLDNGEIDQFIKVNGERWQRHIFADAKCIIDLRDLQEVINNNKRGWLILDALRFRSPGHVSKEVRQFIRDNLHQHSLADAKSIHIFGWGKTSNSGSNLIWEN